MQISNVISGLADPTSWGKKSQAAAAATAGPTKSADTQLPAASSASKASAEILRQYDVTRITPDGFSQMLQKLFKAGVLSEKDFQELSAVRADLEHAGIEPDEPVNLLEFYSDKINRASNEMGASLDGAAKQQRLGPDLRRLDWLQKFAVIQANPDAVGLDMAA